MSSKNRVVFRKLLIFSLVLCLLFSFNYTVYGEENTNVQDAEVQLAQEEQPIIFSAGFLVDDWQKQAEPCDTTSYLVEVQNVADYADTYSLSATSENKLFDESGVAVSENDFTLTSGEKKEVAVFITPHCEIYGKLDVNLNFKSTATELEATILLQTNIARNYTYSLEAGKYETEKQVINNTQQEVSVFKPSNKRYNICNNKKTLLPIKIKNLVETGNIYSLDLEASKAAKKFSKFAHKGVALYGNTEAIIDLELEPELNAIGNYTLTLKTSSERGELELQDKIRVNVRDCFGLKLDIAKEKDKLCNYNSKSYEVKITNNGEFSENIILDAKGDCAKLSQNNLTIAPKQNATANLLINDKCKLTGKHAIEVSASLLNNSEVTSSDNIILEFVDVEKCYKTEIEDGKRQITASENGSKTEVKIQNLGTETVDYSVTLDIKSRILPWQKSRNDFITPVPKEFKLAPNKTQVLALDFDLDNVVPGRYDVKVKATANNKVLFSRNILAIVGKDKFVNFAWYYKYYSLAALIILLILIWTLIASIKESLRIYVEEEFGIVDAGKEITIKIDKEMSPQELKLAAKQQLLDAKIRIEKLSNKKARDAADSVYECFEIAVENIITYNLKSSVLKFKVSKTWLEENNLSHNDISLKILSGEKWLELNTKKTGSDTENVYYKAELKDFGLFAVTSNAEYYKRKAADKKQKEIEEKKKLAEEERKAREEEAKKAKEEKSKEIEEIKAETKEKAEKNQNPAKKEIKKTEDKKKEKKPSTLLEKFAKFAGLLILLLLVVLGVLNGYIYYLAGGIIGAGLIIGILKGTEYYRSDEYKQKRKLLEKQRTDEEREEAKKRTEEERKEAQLKAEEERREREQQKAEEERIRKEEQDKKKQESEQRRRELEQEREEEKQRKLEERKKLQEEAREKREQAKIARAQVRAESRLNKKQKKEKASYAEYLVLALILMVLLVGVIYFAGPKLKDQLKSTLESFNKTTSLQPEIKLLNKTSIINITPSVVNITQPKLEQPKITEPDKTGETPKVLSDAKKAEQLKLEQEKKLTEIKIATELRTQQEEKRLEEEKNKQEQERLKLAEEARKAEADKKLDEEKKIAAEQKKKEDDLKQKQQQEFLKKTLEESVKGAVVKQEFRDEKTMFIDIDFKEYSNKIKSLAIRYLDYIAFGAGLLLIMIVIVNLFKAPKSKAKRKNAVKKEENPQPHYQNEPSYDKEPQESEQNVVRSKKSKKKGLGQRLSKKIVDFFFEEE